LENTSAKSKNIKFFSFKNFLDIKPVQNVIRSFDSLSEIFDPLSVLPEQSPLFTKAPETTPVIQSTEEQTRKMNAALKKIKKTDRILDNLKAKTSKKLDKSYALVEFHDHDTKAKALASDLRLFGLLINGHVCMLDDADHKLTLTCYNVHWGSPIKQFCNAVNGTFEQKNMTDLRVEIPRDFENKILTKFYIHVRFNSFFNTLRAMQALENTFYEKRQLKTHHLYGSLKVCKGKHFESLDADAPGKVQERVDGNKFREMLKIATIPDEIEYEETPALSIDENHENEAVDSQMKKHENELVESVVSRREENELSEEELYTMDLIDRLSREHHENESNSMKGREKNDQH